MENKNNLFNELLNKQKKNIYCSKKLSYRDLNRITKYIDKSIFGEECCIWNGYISKSINEKKYYINFFFKNKKTCLQKLLYQNYIGPLKKREYIKYTCDNSGKCCNINHLIKYLPPCETNDIESDSDSDETNSEYSDLSESGSDFIVTF